MYHGIMTGHQATLNVIVNTLLAMGLTFDDLQIDGLTVTVSDKLITESEVETLRATAKMINNKKQSIAAIDYFNRF